MQVSGFGALRTPQFLVAAAAANALAGVALVQVAPVAALGIAPLPSLVLLAPALSTQTSREVLFSAALALGLFMPWLDRTVGLAGVNIRTQDLIVMLALLGWLLSKLLDKDAPPVPRTGMLGPGVSCTPCRDACHRDPARPLHLRSEPHRPALSARAVRGDRRDACGHDRPAAAPPAHHRALFGRGRDDARRHLPHRHGNVSERFPQLCRPAGFDHSRSRRVSTAQRPCSSPSSD